MVRPGGGGVPGARGRLCYLRSENIDRVGEMGFCALKICSAGEVRCEYVVHDLSNWRHSEGLRLFERDCERAPRLEVHLPHADGPEDLHGRYFVFA